MDPLHPPPMTVVALKVDAFKRIRAAHVTPSPTGLVPVRGKNGAGKSSLIEAMLAALLGKAGAQELPITEGEPGAKVSIDLGDLRVTKTWSRDSGGAAQAKLTVEGANGALLKSPQAILDNLVGRFADPVAFLAMKPADQVKTVLGVLGLDRALEELEARAQEQYDYRREVWREKDRTEKALDQLARELAAEELPQATGNVEELARALEAANQNNGRMDALQRARATAEALGSEARARHGRLREEHARIVNEIARAEEELVERREQWERATAELRTMAPIDTTPITAQLRALEDAQRGIARRELLTRHQEEATAASSIHADAEAALAATRAEIAELLGAARFPVEGMAYDPEAKLLTVRSTGGQPIPFGQASQAERLRISTAIAMAGSQAIRVLFIREGSLLDDDSLALVAGLAEQHGFQLWCEIVDSSREGAGVYIEDGQAFQ